MYSTRQRASRANSTPAAFDAATPRRPSSGAGDELD
jgi:hypothetical protein